MTSKLIVIEGLDGSGLTTQATLLRNWLIDKGEEAILTKEPTDGLLGGLIKAALNKEWKVSNQTLQLLFVTDRSHHLESVIEPALKTGKTVICDRYMFSTIAFGGIDVGMERLEELNKTFRKPDLAILIDVDPETCLKRIKASRPKFELFEQKEKLERIRKNYHVLAKKHNLQIVDGTKSIEDVHREIVELVKKSIQ